MKNKNSFSGIKKDDNKLSCRKRECRGNSHELEGVFFKISSYTKIFTRLYSYKHTQLIVFSASIISESMSAEVMATVDYVMRKVWEEIDKELLRKFENQQFK